jgi:putative ATP-binding cassette transporter
MATLTGDIPSVIGAMTMLPLLCMNIAVVAGSLAYMGYLSWRILLGVLLFLVVGVVAYQIPVRRAQRHIDILRERMDELFRHFRAVTEGLKELKLHHERRRAFLDDELQGTVIELQGHSVAAQRLYASAVSWGQVLVFILIGLIAFLLPEVLDVDKAVLTGYTLAILYMVNPTQAVMNSFPQLGRATTAMRRIEELGGSLAEAAQSGPPLPERTEVFEWTSLELEGVTHTYRSERDGSSFTLGPMDLSFRPGEIVFLTGGNGSGKTTLAKLLTGLYAPETGRILLDGVPVSDATRPRYQGLFSAVFSDYYLFDSLLGLAPEGLDEEATRLLAELQLDHKVTIEKGVLSSIKLSQGQRKRLALLVAYLEDRPIYLFDEWAADQDPHFKRVFYYEILPQLKQNGKTVFAVSHDDRFYDVADRVVKLESGQLVEEFASGALPERVAMADARPGA